VLASGAIPQCCGPKVSKICANVNFRMFFVLGCVVPTVSNAYLSGN